MKMGNKINSEDAMDFLMTYGWAILVVIIALGALFYFNILSLNPDDYIGLNKTEIEEVNCTTYKRIIPLASNCREVNKLLLEGKDYIFDVEHTVLCTNEDHNHQWIIKAGSTIDAYIMRCIN